MTIETTAPRSATPTRGRAVPLPTRREGPAKLTGQALYADDLVFPGAWYGATIRSTDPHARLLAIELDPAFDWSKVAVVTADDIPGRNVVASIADDQPILVPVRGEIQHQAEPVALLAAADRETLREARTRVTLRTEALPPVFDPLDSSVVFAHHELIKGDVDAALAEDGLEIIEATYRVGHQEQLYIENNAIIARAARGRRDDRPRQPPVPVLRAQGAQGGPEPRRCAHPGRPGGDGRRVRREGGVPVDDLAPCRAAGSQDRPAGADDLRPPRGPVGDDQAPPGGDPLPHRRPTRRDDRRPGHRPGDGRRRVHDADAGRPLARDHPRRRPVRRRERPHPLAGGGDQHAAQRRLPRLRGAPGRVRRGDADEPRRRRHRPVAARDPPSQRLPAGRRDAHQPAAARRCRRHRGPGPGRRGERVRAAPVEDGRRARRAPAGGADRARRRARAGLAWRRVHRLGRGEDGLDRQPRAHGRRPDPHPHRVDRDGPGDEDDLSAAGGGRARDRRGRRRDGAPGHGVRARLRADGRVADGDGGRRPADRGRAAPAGRGRGPDGAAVRPLVARRRQGPRLRPDRRALHALRGPHVRRRHLQRRRLSHVRVGGGRRRGRGRPGHGRGRRPVGRRGRRRRAA